MPFTKATQGTVNREGIIEQPWKFDFQLTVISTDPTTHSQLESNQLMPYRSSHALFRSHHYLNVGLNILDSERFLHDPYTRISFHNLFLADPSLHSHLPSININSIIYIINSKIIKIFIILLLLLLIILIIIIIIILLIIIIIIILIIIVVNDNYNNKIINDH